MNLMKWLGELFGWDDFGDRLALFLSLAILSLWALEGFGLINLEDQVSGALIGAFSAIVMLYFKNRGNNGSGNPPGVPPNP